MDAVICAGVVGHALRRLPASVPAYAMSPIVYGKSEEHLHFPGTITLTGETLLATMIEVAESVYRAGFRKLLIVNGHGGQPQIMEIMAREMRLRHGDYVVVPQHTWRLPHVAGRYMSDKREEARDACRPRRDRDPAGARARHGAHGARRHQLPARIPVQAVVARWPTRPVPGQRATSARAASSATPCRQRREQGEAILESLAVSWAQAITDLHALRWVERDEATWRRVRSTPGTCSNRLD